PDLKLNYSSQGRDNVSPFGIGWSASIPFIERINRYGVDKLYATSSIQVYYSSFSGELASTTSTSTFAAKIEKGDFIKYTYSNNSWLAIDKASTTYRFGTTTAGREDDPNDSSRIYRWMLQEVRDANDNSTTYEYTKDSGNIYPSKIKYTFSSSTP